MKQFEKKKAYCCKDVFQQYAFLMRCCKPG
jgi:hypothetical protein